MPEHDAASVSDVVPMGAHSHRWTLGLKQSSFGHIARVMQRAVLDASGRPLFSWHALVPSRFRGQVSQLTQERSSKFFPTALGIQRSASRRTPGVRVTSHPAQATGRPFKVSERTPMDRGSRVTFTRMGISLFPWVSARLLVRATRHLATSAPFQVGHRTIRQVMNSLCLSAVGIRFLAILSREGVGCALRPAYCLDRPYRGFHVPHRQATSGELASRRREPGTVSAGPANPC